jgi:anti-anti-sigma factor
MAPEHDPIHVASRLEDREMVVTASGDVNRRNSGRLKAELRRHSGRVAIDLRGVQHMNGTGISLLLKEKQRLEESGGSLRVIGGSKLRSLFEMTGLKGILDVQESDSDSAAE